jgi:hypothetical protein
MLFLVLISRYIGLYDHNLDTRNKTLQQPTHQTLQLRLRDLAKVNSETIFALLR